MEIAYIGMGPENGGLVLDVSDGGLSFHAVAPVQPHETIRFLLSLRGHSRIEGAGEVVWTNEMRTICGLRFTSLSGDAREQLNNWTNQTQMQVAVSEKAMSPPPQMDPYSSDASPMDADSEPVFAIPPAAESYSADPMVSTSWQQPPIFWILFGFLGAALTLGGYIYGVHVGRSQISAVTRSATAPDAQTRPAVPAPAPVPASTLASGAPSAPTDAPVTPSEAPPITNGTPGKTPKTEEASPSSVKPSGAEGNSADSRGLQPGQPSEGGQSELDAALASLRGTNGTPDSFRAARLLWAAVGKGNSSAEVILADLYVRGAGVPKSCEQGRVLLRAASKSGNHEAETKLRELNTKGCK